MARLPSLRLHKASGQAVVTIRGRDYYLGDYLDSNGRKSAKAKAKYDRLIAEYFASGQSRTFGVRPDELTVVEAIRAYLDFAKQRYGSAPESDLHRIKPVLRVLKKLYGREAMRDFKPLWWKAIRENLDDGRLARRYVNRMMGLLNRFIKWCASEEYVSPEVYATVRLIPSLAAGKCKSGEREDVKPVDQTIVNATLPQLNPIVAAMVEFQLSTGCRPGEVVQITPSMIDRSGDVWRVVLTKHKTAWRGKKRTIYVGPEAQAVLKPYLFRAADKPCFSPQEAMEWVRRKRTEERVTAADQGNVVGSKRARKPKRQPGEKYTTQSYGRSIRYACQKAEIECWSPNQLRHTAATQIRKQYGLEGAGVMLGHSKLDVTQIYAEANEEFAIEIARKHG